MSTLRGPIFILNPATITFDGVNSTPAASGYPLTNLTDYVHPLRTYRSTSDPASNPTELFIDLGAAIPRVDAIFIDNTNLATWVIQHSSTGLTGSYTDWTAEVTTEVDPLTGRAKVFIDSTDLGDNSRYLKLYAAAQTPIGTPTDASRVGSVVIGYSGDVVDLPSHGVGSIEFTRIIPTEVTEFQGGSVEYVQLGSTYVVIDLPEEPYIRETQEDDILAIIRKNLRPFVFYENGGYTNRAYVVRHNELETKAGYVVSSVINLPLSFREQV
jgi:hypothetical protein